MSTNSNISLRQLLSKSVTGLFIALLLALAPSAMAKFSLGGGKPLPVEEAFIPTVDAHDRSTLNISFVIADGYYLYRDKTVITTSTDAATLQSPDFPEAIIVNDEFFGETATYRERVSFAVPMDVESDVDTLDINVRFQGCADIGICYPPTDTQLTVALPKAKNASLTASKKIEGGLAKLVADSSSAPADLAPQSSTLTKSKTGLELFSEELPLLSPEQAFIPTVAVSKDHIITLEWFIEPGYYLYRDKTALSLVKNQNAISGVEYSESTIQYDEFFGDVSVFRHQASITASASNLRHAKDELTVRYQGCADIGVCFPPKSITLPVAFTGELGSGNASMVTAALADNNASAQTIGSSQTTKQTAQAPVAEQDRIRAKLSSSSLWINAASFFVLGLLLSFTPCVFPMIPILSSLILGQGKSLSTGKAFGLSLTYVLAMAVTYTLVGVFIGLSGYNLQAMFQNPWVLSAFALIFVLLSLSMFGFYEIQMPQAIQNKINSWSNKQESGSWIGVAVMGVLSALIVGPCVTAPLVGALIYIAETGDATVGGVALFSMSLGMGLPLLVIGTSAGKIMPKAGAWMDITKVIFGLTMLAMGIWMLSRFLPANVILVLSAILAICGGIYLGTTTRFGNTIKWLSTSVGLILTLYGAALMLGLLSGNYSLTTPLARVNSGGVAESHEIVFERIKTEADLQQVLSEASANNQFVMFDYYADWCVSCKEMEAYTFTDPSVQASLGNVRLIQADVTRNDAEDQALMKRFGIFGPPAILFFKPGGEELANARVVGYMKAAAFNNHLATFLK